MFVWVDGGVVEEPLVESLEVVPFDLNRMVKYWLYEVVDPFGDEAEVQGRLPLNCGSFYDGDDRLCGQGGEGVAVVGHREAVPERGC